MKRFLMLLAIVGFTLFLRNPYTVREGAERVAEVRSIHVMTCQVTQTGVVAGTTDDGKKIILPLREILQIVED